MGRERDLLNTVMADINKKTKELIYSDSAEEELEGYYRDVFPSINSQGVNTLLDLHKKGGVFLEKGKVTLEIQKQIRRKTKNSVNTVIPYLISCPYIKNALARNAKWLSQYEKPTTLPLPKNLSLAVQEVQTELSSKGMFKREQPTFVKGKYAFLASAAQLLQPTLSAQHGGKIYKRSLPSEDNTNVGINQGGDVENKNKISHIDADFFLASQPGTETENSLGLSGNNQAPSQPLLAAVSSQESTQDENEQEALIHAWSLESDVWLADIAQQYDLNEDELANMYFGDEIIIRYEPVPDKELPEKESITITLRNYLENREYWLTEIQGYEAEIFYPDKYPATLQEKITFDTPLHSHSNWYSTQQYLAEKKHLAGEITISNFDAYSPVRISYLFRNSAKSPQQNVNTVIPFHVFINANFRENMLPVLKNDENKQENYPQRYNLKYYLPEGMDESDIKRITNNLKKGYNGGDLIKDIMLSSLMDEFNVKTGRLLKSQKMNRMTFSNDKYIYDAVSLEYVIDSRIGRKRIDKHNPVEGQSEIHWPGNISQDLIKKLTGEDFRTAFLSGADIISESVSSQPKTLTDISFEQREKTLEKAIKEKVKSVITSNNGTPAAFTGEKDVLILVVNDLSREIESIEEKLAIRWETGMLYKSYGDREGLTYDLRQLYLDLNYLNEKLCTLDSNRGVYDLIKSEEDLDIYNFVSELMDDTSHEETRELKKSHIYPQMPIIVTKQNENGQGSFAVLPLAYILSDFHEDPGKKNNQKVEWPVFFSEKNFEELETVRLKADYYRALRKGVEGQVKILNDLKIPSYYDLLQGYVDDIYSENPDVGNEIEFANLNDTVKYTVVTSKLIRQAVGIKKVEKQQNYTTNILGVMAKEPERVAQGIDASYQLDKLIVDIDGAYPKEIIESLRSQDWQRKIESVADNLEKNDQVRRSWNAVFSKIVEKKLMGFNYSKIIPLKIEAREIVGVFSASNAKGQYKIFSLLEGREWNYENMAQFIHATNNDNDLYEWLKEHLANSYKRNVKRHVRKMPTEYFTTSELANKTYDQLINSLRVDADYFLKSDSELKTHAVFKVFKDLSPLIAFPLAPLSGPTAVLIMMGISSLRFGELIVADKPEEFNKIAIDSFISVMTEPVIPASLKLAKKVIKLSQPSIDTIKKYFKTRFNTKATFSNDIGISMPSELDTAFSPEYLKSPTADIMKDLDISRSYNNAIRKIEAKKKVNKKFEEEFELGEKESSTLLISEVDKLNVRGDLTPSQMRKIFVSRSSTDAKKPLTAKELGALSERIKKKSHDVERDSIMEFFRDAKKISSESEVKLLPQSALLELAGESSAGRCLPLSRVMALAIENGSVDFVINKYLNASVKNNRKLAEELKNLLKNLHSSSKIQDYSQFKKQSIKNIVDRLDEGGSHYLTISSPNHAMMAGKKINDHSTRWYFYDPNFGLLSFSSKIDLEKALHQHFVIKGYAQKYLSGGIPYAGDSNVLAYDAANYGTRKNPLFDVGRMNLDDIKNADAGSSKTVGDFITPV
ncbi:hypothetical protein [Candidatus Pantoea multigeneris]|uniref:Peptidase C58 YopT-type domain-containing protein n=1 Tax=Candidatus Pantoea multigeneris TaxID=2608357 RepID=A0ABX0R661_9GAMM|nr:hypothetical protein [Pantoea multigeneris]NIF20887.1 hypothetical protein [Pantoea multigeneris]